MKKKTGIWEGIFWVGIGGLLCLLALHFDLGSFRAPGAGFVAFLAGIFIGVMGAVLIASESLSISGGKEEVPSPAVLPFGARGRLVYTLSLLVFYAVLMDPLGFILSTFLAMFGLFFDWNRRNWFWSVFFSIATTLTSYLVFEVWLRCQLPRGVFPWW